MKRKLTSRTKNSQKGRDIQIERSAGPRAQIRLAGYPLFADKAGICHCRLCQSEIPVLARLPEGGDLDRRGLMAVLKGLSPLPYSDGLSKGGRYILTLGRVPSGEEFEAAMAVDAIKELL